MRGVVTVLFLALAAPAAAAPRWGDPVPFTSAPPIGASTVTETEGSDVRACPPRPMRGRITYAPSRLVAGRPVTITVPRLHGTGRATDPESQARSVLSRHVTVVVHAR